MITVSFESFEDEMPTPRHIMSWEEYDQMKKDIAEEEAEITLRLQEMKDSEYNGDDDDDYWG